MTPDFGTLLIALWLTWLEWLIVLPLVQGTVQGIRDVREHRKEEL
jgi:hypothetical protein